MGKASKWIRNLLLGKKEEKINKKLPTSSSSSSSTENVSKSLVIPAAATPPVEKRRWSFGRSSSTDKSMTVHKSTRSFDSIITPQLVSQAVVEYANLQQHHRSTAVVLPPKFSTPLPSARAIVPKFGPVENAAATKLQAYFRSYLARKALRALRGLVKLQALVRGHLVRKQTTAMVRCMNALMSIQVRARVHRIQMAEDSYVVTKTRKIHREQAQDNMLRRPYREGMKDLKVTGGIKSHHGYLNPQQTDTMEHLYNTHSSRRVSVSRREHQQLYPLSLTSTHASSRMYDQQVEGLSLSTTHSTSQHYTTSRAMYLDTCMSSSVMHEELESHQLVPSYMAKTESSMAKVRSQSEPKQRPVKKKSRRTASNEGISSALTRSSSSRMRGSFHKNRKHWLVKLYRSSNSIKDIEYDETSTSTNNSSYCSTLVAYEPAVIY